MPQSARHIICDIVDRLGLSRGLAPFELPYEPYGVGDTERCIEIPWAVSCYRGEKTVLDVGYANAEERYLKELLSLKIPHLYGLDMVKKDIQGMTSIVGDVRKTNFPDDYFDLISCISTIEHIGRDNTVYCDGRAKDDDKGDLHAMKELCRITKAGGKIVVTAPYGEFHDYGWFINYDEARWKRLKEASGCCLLRENFYIYNGGWRKTEKGRLKGILYRDNNAPAAAGLACALLMK